MLVIIFAATGTIVAQLEWQDICIICAYDIMLVFFLDVLKVGYSSGCNALSSDLASTAAEQAPPLTVDVLTFSSTQRTSLSLPDSCGACGSY